MQSPETSGHHTNSTKRNCQSTMNDTSNLQQHTQYLLNVFKVARRRNTIAYLDAGAEKTMVVIMIINEVALSLKNQPFQKKLIIFLAPTSNLVEQQFNVLRESTGLLVDFYHGTKVANTDGKKVDQWDASVWDHETNKNQVMVMTPQVLLDALRNAFMNFETICLLIIDECHHATGNHPYVSIMKEFYLKPVNKPKIFGMTASLVSKKGISSVGDCKARITMLESVLDSLVFTIQNSTELENVTPSASLKYSFYQPSKVDHIDLKVKLKYSQVKFEVQLYEAQLKLQRSYRDTDEKHDIFQKRLSNDHSKIIYYIDELGLLCAYEAVKICIANTQKAIEECDLFKDSCSKCLNFLEESLSLIDKFLPNGHENMFDAGCDFEKMVAAGYISPKLYKLFQLFLSFRGASKVSCIIFVEKTITAKVLDMVLKRVADLPYFQVSYLTNNATSVDTMSEKLQKETLEAFCSGKVNLLFATNVVEESINMSIPSAVIRFDIPKGVPSNVQSQGGAHQIGSRLIIMLERGNAKQREYVCDIIRSEYLMNESAKKGDPDTSNLKETESYYVGSTGASVTADSSLALIHRYCAKLPANKFYPLNPNFQVLLVEDSYQCVMTLPPSADFQKIMGPLCKSSALSKQLVCLEACKKLHQMGALTDHLLPKSEDPSDNNFSNMTKESLSSAGTKKRKELHGTTRIRAVSRDKLDDGADFHAYKISFICSIGDVKYSSFVLLFQSKLDDDVANLEMKSYLGSKLVNCKVSSSLKLYLDAEQVAKAKCFQEFFVNVIFAKDVSYKQSETNQKVWTASYMYFLLPLESRHPCGISWKEIDSCISMIEIVKKSSVLTSSAGKQGVGTDSESPNMIHFANGSVHKDHVTNVVVLEIHSGHIYSVVEVLQGQSLLLLKQSHGTHLVDLNDKGVLHGKMLKADGCKVNMGRQRYAHILPKLLFIINIRIDVVESFYLLPSLMHQLESLMLASQLREEITGHMTDIRISSSLILEAITTKRCNESFSMERLELLGDSVLKYAVSCDLYLRYPKKHEGPLVHGRSWEVSNYTLYNLGIGCQLQGYIRDVAFDPTRWTAPGQLPLRPCPCDHGVETIEVPIDAKYHTEDPTVVTGICCDRGHRWLGSKTISDCVEALVGAYFVGGGLNGALHCIKWLGLSCEHDPCRVNEAIQIASLHAYTPKLDVLQSLESKIGYEFAVKGLLLEAITHQGTEYCYQRLKFLGGSVLDLLITWYLYRTYNDIGPGELTSLRSASVNNKNFADAAVRKDLHPYLRCSEGLQTRISDYAKSITTSSTSSKKTPKALGGLMNGIAGAMLLDIKLDLDQFWRIFKPLLTPMVTPEKHKLPPLHENMNRHEVSNDVISELRLKLEDVSLIAEGTGTERKIARSQAALEVCSQLKVQKRGISSKNEGEDNRESDTSQPKTTPLDPQPAAHECFMEKDCNSIIKTPVIKKFSSKNESEDNRESDTGRPKTTPLDPQPAAIECFVEKDCNSNIKIPVIKKISSKNEGEDNRESDTGRPKTTPHDPQPAANECFMERECNSDIKIPVIKKISSKNEGEDNRECDTGRPKTTPLDPQPTANECFMERECNSDIKIPVIKKFASKNEGEDNRESDTGRPKTTPHDPQPAANECSMEKDCNSNIKIPVKKKFASKNEGEDNNESDTGRPKTTPLDPQPAANECFMEKDCNSNIKIPVIKKINTEKGGPRAALTELCTKMQWPMPILTPSVEISKTPIESGGKRTSFHIHRCRISLAVPDHGALELTGDPRGDKKSSVDSAALLVLSELQRLGKLEIGCDQLSLSSVPSSPSCIKSAPAKSLTAAQWPTNAARSSTTFWPAPPQGLAPYWSPYWAGSPPPCPFPTQPGWAAHWQAQQRPRAQTWQPSLTPQAQQHP